MYQPKYPLKYKDAYGPYESIISIKESIKQNVKTLLLTSPGEWPNRPDFGVGIKRFLFENSTSPELDALHKRIADQFSKYLPFVKVKSEFVKEDAQGTSLVDRNEIKLVIRYLIEPLSESDTMIFGLGDSLEY
jgi:phage baseplate assembly protein W|tara:strand:- start:1425 stop:1823 length:399 start_codon:yes stop_codon:yes gene_type:complete